MDECLYLRLKIRTLDIYTYVQSAGYRLILCSTAYENTPKCGISIENVNYLIPTSTPRCI